MGLFSTKIVNEQEEAEELMRLEEQKRRAYAQATEMAELAQKLLDLSQELREELEHGKT